MYKLVENEVELNLKIIEAPKFGDKLDNTKCWQKIENYLNNCFDQQMLLDSTVDRSDAGDSIDPLVHVCLYFIQPRSSKLCLREIDLEFLKNIHNKVR